MDGDCATGTVTESWNFAYDGDGVRVATAHDVGGNIAATRYFFGGAYETRSDGTTIRYYSFAGDRPLRHLHRAHTCPGGQCQGALV